MNFVGKFDAKLPVEGSVAHPVAFAHVDGASTHAPSDAIIVPDAQLLFGGDFKRSGVDLVLSKDDHELVLHDYFKGEKRAALASPDGAHLTGDLVNALTGHVEYAQADGAVAAAAVVVGHVTKLTGSATAIRNGVSIILNQGDNIDKGDVLQSGADSTLGVTFVDGTVFGLSSNARMVVNEMVYDPNGSNNSSLLSLVAGTISFVAGETAKHGDMKVDTPVATMGIRGTAVLVEIDFAVPGQNGAPSANFQVLVEPDGTTGSYILFDKNTLAPLATVNTAGTLTKISQGVVTFQAGSPLTPDEQKLINDLFTTKFGDNTKSIDHHFTDTPVPQSLAPIKLADGIIVTPVIQIVTNPGGLSLSGPGGGTAGVLHIPGPPAVGTSSGAFIEHANVTGGTAFDTQIGQIRFADVNAGDRPTVKIEFSSFTYQDAQQHDITQALSPTEQAAIKAVEAISLNQDAGNNNNGSATWTYSFPDGAFDFLGAGETLTLTYTALVDNNFLQSPEIGTKQFTVTITGTNDHPVITSSIPQTIAFVGGTSVPGGDLTAHVPTTGTMTFDDPDLTDTHTVSVKLLLDGLDLPPTPLQIFKNALTASIATDSTGTGFGTVNWKLADLPVYLADFIPKGETITLTYVVTVTDSQGTSSKQDITVTITGTDTPAVVWIATSSGSSSGGLWSDASNWETGTAPTANDDAIIITDQLIGLTPSDPVTITEAAEAKSLTMDNFGISAPILINQSTLTIGGVFSMTDHATADSDAATDPDSTTKHTPPELDNQGTLTTGGAFDMGADSIVHNSGTIKVGGLMEVLDTSVLDNSGALILQHGGDFKGQSTITNTDTGSIEISGGTLSVQVDVANDGLITIDSGAAMTVGIATITGGTVTNDGTLSLNGVAPPDPSSDSAPVTGTAALKDGTLNNAGVLDAQTGALLQNENVTNTGTIEVLALGALTLDQGTTIHNTGGTIAIDGTGTLTLDNATIDGGTINDFSLPASPSGSIIPGDIDVTGSSTISNAHLNNGQLTVESDQTLTLEDGTIVVGGALDNSGTVAIESASGATLDGVTVTGTGTIQVDRSVPTTSTPLVLEDGTSITNGKLKVGPVGVVAVKTAKGATLNGVDVTNDNSIEVFAAGVLALGSGTIIDNTSGIITIDGTGALTLSQATIDGGTINDFSTPPSGSVIAGDIDVTGSSTISNAHLHNGHVTIGANQTLTLDGTTVTGTTFADTADGASIQIDGGTTLTLDHATINGGTINDYSTPASGSVIAGDIDVTGSSTISNAHLNNGQVTIEANQTLTLDDDTITGTHFADASGAVIQIDGGTTLKLDHVTIDGGTINDFSTPASGSMIAGDIDVIGSSTISNAQLNHGNVTIESGQTLTLDNDTVTGTAFTGVATGSVIHVDGGETLTLNSATVSGGGLTIGADALVKTSGDVSLTDTSVTNDGTIEITGGTLKITGSVASSGPDASGSIKIDGGAVLDLDGSDTQNVVFAGSNGELKIDTSSFGGNISGLAATDQIDLSTIGYGPGTTGTYSGGVLTITDGTHSISMTLTGDYSDAHFAGASDGHGGTLITLNANDDAPTFDSADTAQTAKVTELAETTGSTVSDSSSPANGTIHFTDIDLTDRPTATITQSVAWTSGTTDLSSSLTSAEADALEHAFALTQSGNTNNGTIGWSYQISDSALDFLGAGETAQVTSTVLLDDHQNGHDTATVTVTITGTNDAPGLAVDTSGTAGTTLHAIAERAGVTGDTADQDSASGTLSFTDADLTDTHTLSHSGPTYALSGGTLTTTQADALTAAAQLNLSEIDSTHSGAGSVDFSYYAPDSSFDFLAAGQTLTVSYTVTVTDNSNISSSQPVTFTITGSNDAPAVEAHNSTLSYTENQAPAAIDPALTLSDVDSATLGVATVQISGNFVAGEDVLGFTDQNGIHGSYDAVHGILTLTGTSSVANYQAALASVTYFDSSDHPSAAPRTISFSVDDGATANSHSNVATAAVNVIPVNDAPVVTFAAPEGNAILVPENTATHLTGISVSDVDAGACDITMTLALPDGSSGSLSAGNFDGVTIGGSAIALTITGSLAEINAFLADTQHGVTYTPATGLIHDVTLAVTANDHGATGSGGALESAPQPVLLDLVPDSVPGSHANLIVNGGFETGDFAGWKLGNDIGHSNAIGINFLVGSARAENQGAGDMAHHGLGEALFGGIGDDATLSQSQSVATNANEHYTVDFWVMNDTSASSGEHGSGANDFSASWNGVSLMPTIVNANQGGSYTEYQFDVTGAAGHSTLEFSARNDNGYWNLDDVSVREGAPDTVNQLTDETTSVSGVHAGDALTVTAADPNSLGTVTATAGAGTIEWQFAASNAQLDHLMGLTQTYTVSDASNPAVAQTLAVSIGGLGHDQFVFNPGVGADTMVNFSTVSNSQGAYIGDTVELDKFSNIQSVSDVLHNLSTDAHGNAVVDLGNHDSITFQGINAATIQANAMHMFVLHSTSGNIA